MCSHYHLSVQSWHATPEVDVLGGVVGGGRQDLRIIFLSDLSG